MTSKMFSLALAGSAVLGLSVSAFAGANKPASLLVYPCYDNSRSTETLITVTNTQTAITESVQVEFVYINGYNCLETNRTRTLTAGDTLTVLASADNPNSNMGYVYVFAKRNGAAISYNHLIGTSITLSGSDTRDFELDPIAFLASGADNATTDTGDGRRDLDGVEYEQAPGELAFPRFVGQGNGVESRLILINLVGARFNAVLDFLVYNDNEEVFSAQRTIDCWDRVLLSDVNGVFNNDFLYNNTNHATGEVAGISFNETGWFSVKGTVANSSNDVVLNPAILAALVESVHGDGGGMLPWQLGSGRNGELLNLSIQSDL